MRSLESVRAWLLRASAATAVLVFLVFVARFWSPVWGFTAFLQLDASNDEVKISAFKTEPVYVYRNVGGYDGLYYAQLAYHPTLRAPELAGAMDNFSYRARRILAPALAWLLAFGQPAWIVQVYSVLNIFCWLILAALLWRALPVREAKSWLAWFSVLFSTGCLISVRLALTDLVALVILLAAVIYSERRTQAGRASGALLMAAAGLARETSLLASPGLLRRPWLSRANALVLVVAGLPLAAWIAYIRFSFDSHDTWVKNMSPPFGGIWWKLHTDIVNTIHGGGLFAPVTVLSALSLGVTIGLIVQAIYFIARPRLDETWWRVGVLYVPLMMTMGVIVWEGAPGAAARVMLPMTLAFNLLVIKRKDNVAWLLLGNLAVLHGVTILRQAPNDPHELVAARVNGAAVVGQTDERWFPVERTWRDRSAWSPSESGMELETWPHDNRQVHLRASVQSRGPMVLSVTQDGALLWRSTLMPKPFTMDITCQVRAGHGHLAFTTNVPGAALTPPVPRCGPGLTVPPCGPGGVKDPVFELTDVRFD
jgi:hypothetical protein